jgi:hypothetical protein
MESTQCHCKVFLPGLEDMPQVGIRLGYVDEILVVSANQLLVILCIELPGLEPQYRVADCGTASGVDGREREEE